MGKIGPNISHWGRFDSDSIGTGVYQSAHTTASWISVQTY